MTRGEIMVALGIVGLALTFIIFLISSIVLHRRERKLQAELERNELALVQGVNANEASETELLDREKIETELMETAVLKDTLKKTDILNL
jgi:type II secretory pathway pseudopilin PulG